MSDKIKVGIYARLSKDDGDDKESESIENQKTEIIKYVEKQPNWVIHDIYFDDGYTGLNFERPDFKRLKQDIINKKIDVIVCTKQSRIGRDSSGVDNFLFSFLIDMQVRCIGILDGLDNFNKSNKKSAQITGLTNEWYSEEISYSVKAAFDAKRSRGEFIGAYAPYGYKKHPENKNKLIIDEETAPIVKEIFKLYLDGYGYVKIAQILTSRNIPTPSQYKGFPNNNTIKLKNICWSYHTVRMILQNEVYIGNLVQKKSKTLNFKSKKRVKTHKSEIIRIENTHEPLIDKNTFELVQTMLNMRTKPRKTEESKHLFSGLIFCGDCGRNLGYRSDSNSFICMSYRNYGEIVCKKHYIKLDELECVVLADIKSLIDNYIEFKERELSQFELKYNKKISTINAEINKLNRRLSELIPIKMGLYEDYKSTILSKDEFLNYKNIYTTEEHSINEKIKLKTEELNNLKESFNKNNDIDKFYKKYIDIDNLNHTIVNKFLKSIEIFENQSGEITIQINYKTSVPTVMPTVLM